MIHIHVHDTSHNTYVNASSKNQKLVTLRYGKWPKCHENAIRS